MAWTVAVTLAWAVRTHHFESAVQLHREDVAGINFRLVAAVIDPAGPGVTRVAPGDHIVLSFHPELRGRM